MALPGEEIRPKAKRQKKTETGPPGSARARLAALIGREAQASQDILSDDKPEPSDNNSGPSNVDQADEVDNDNNEAYDELITDINNPENLENEPANIIQMNRSQYFRSVTYAERTLRQEANWKAVIPKLFEDFLPCSHMTFQWGHPQLWNHDWNEECKCRDWQIHDVVIDTIDILVNMGYIGTTPTRPRTAVSIRLLRFHHILWKFSGVRLAPFVECLEEFLDAHNVMFLVSGSDQPRDLRRCFSEAVDVYREMIRLEEEMSTRALKLSPLEELADNCPSCFGPKIPGIRATEPDLIICLDANFQQRRHLSASAAWRGDTGVVPSLFIPPAEVKMWKDRIESVPNRRAGRAAEKVIDPCSAQHTAANDTRGRQTWRGCDETGLMGMACRHDHLLKFINLVQSGERGYYPLAILDWILRKTVSGDDEAPRFGILYDIGCNMEKSIIKRDLFQNERAAGRLKFGTSVFHSHVHQWACQLKYNPRLNDDWGLSDGEGLERIWSSLAALVGALRYSTKVHRLCALNLRARHTNRVKRSQSIKWLKKRLSSSRKLFHESMGKLRFLRARNPICTEDYLKRQWAQQRETQLQAMVNENSHSLTSKLTKLVGLEERHKETDDELGAVQAKQRKSASDRRKLVLLPQTMQLLEEEIDALVVELGGDHYRDMPGPGTPKGKMLIRIRVSKSKLYGARVDVLEMQRKNDEREGTRMQQHTKKTLRDKQLILKSKYNLFERNVTKFNNDFPANNPIVCPPFEEMKRLSLQDGFWDIGQLTHPDQPWAVDKDTQEGIRAYLDKTHASDELNRISRECRQSINWALKVQDKLSALKTAVEHIGDDPDDETNKWIVSVVGSRLTLPTVRLKKSKRVLWALYSRIKQEHARLMIRWNCGMLELFSSTRMYCQLTEQQEFELRTRWSNLAVMSRVTWSEGAQADIVEAVPLDEDEEAEMLLNLEDDDGDDENGVGVGEENEEDEILDEDDLEGHGSEIMDSVEDRPEVDVGAGLEGGEGDVRIGEFLPIYFVHLGCKS
ncbi:hypothetical protein DFH28DRAFT_936433 [Melampsora americana]|nr:hypothetical protein DFH28DRAFT_936433 [Melampsora americana]